MRECVDCGATPADATFEGDRKPRGRPDRCLECQTHPLVDFRARVEARRTEIMALRNCASAKNRVWRQQKPHWSAPLFAGLAPKR
jgi:hypothetical protein